MIPAFIIGRTQEFLYELEEIIHQALRSVGGRLRAISNPGLQEQVGGSLLGTKVEIKKNSIDQKINWQDLEIIIDSLLASKFTDVYGELKTFWDKEALRKVKNNRISLNYNNFLTINTHKEHFSTVNYLAKNKRSAIVIAASGMCNGGRIMNNLKAMLDDSRHDVVFIGCQAKGMLGRIIQKYGPAKKGIKTGYVDMDGQRLPIQAEIHTIGGYSAHAGQEDLLNFVRRMWFKPKKH